MYPIQNSMYSLSNTILSGYTQMNQMRAMLAASGNSKLSAISGVSNVTSSTANKLDADSAAFLKDYQKQMTALKDAADGVLNPKTDKLAAGSSDRTVATVTGKLESQSDSYELTVQQTAAGQVNRSTSFVSNGELPSMGGGLQIKTAAGTFDFSLSAAGAKTNQEALQKFADSINASRAGVTARVVTENGRSSLELEGASGSDNKFTVSGTAAESLGLDKAVTESRDAIFTITRNDGETYSGTSSTNAVEVDGVSINIAGTGKAQIKAGINDGAAASAMQDLVDAYNSTIKFLSSNEDRGVGVLQQMKRMIQPPVSESSMSMIGLTVKADGTLSFDQDVFNKATDASPSLMGSIAERVASGIKQDAQRGLDAPSASLVGSAAKQRNMFGSSAFSSSQMDSISMMSTYNRLGAYNMSNYYAVGMMMNMFV